MPTEPACARGVDGFVYVATASGVISRPKSRAAMNRPPYPGRCVCGAVRYRLTAEPLTVYACHCTDCQALSGSAFRLSMPVLRDAVEITHGAPEEFRYAPVGAAPKRGKRCRDCGTWLWGEPERLPQIRVLRPSTLDDRSWVDPVAHIWVGSAQPWMRIPDGVLTFPGQPPDDRELVRAWKAKHPG